LGSSANLCHGVPGSSLARKTCRDAAAGRYQQFKVPLFRRSGAANPWLYYTHLALAAGPGLNGQCREAAMALAKGTRIKPELNSLSRQRSYLPYAMNLPVGLREETVEVGLLRAGMPEE